MVVSASGKFLTHFNFLANAISIWKQHKIAELKVANQISPHPAALLSFYHLFHPLSHPILRPSISASIPFPFHLTIPSLSTQPISYIIVEINHQLCNLFTHAKSKKLTDSSTTNIAHSVFPQSAPNNPLTPTYPKLLSTTPKFPKSSSTLTIFGWSRPQAIQLDGASRPVQ